MSGLFQTLGGTVEGFGFKITVNTPVVIAGSADFHIRVPWFQVTEIAGGVATLTIDLYDGTTAYFLRNALAMTAKGTYLFEAGIWLNRGWFLRVTTSLANQADVVGTRSLPTKFG